MYRFTYFLLIMFLKMNAIYNILIMQLYLLLTVGIVGVAVISISFVLVMGLV